MTPEEQRRIFCKNLNKYVSQSTKNQKEIAVDLCVRYTTFNTWMRGTSMPQSAATIQNIADYFGIGKTDLLDEYKVDNIFATLTKDEYDFLLLYRKLNDAGKQFAATSVEMLTRMDQYRK